MSGARPAAAKVCLSFPGSCSPRLAAVKGDGAAGSSPQTGGADMRHPGRAPSAAGGTMVRDKPGLRVPPPPASATRSAEWRQTQRCRWGCPQHAAGPAQGKVTLTWPRPSAPFPTPPGSPCSLLPSLDHSRSHSHSEDHLRPLLLSFPDPWTWAQPHSAHLPRAKAPDQVPAAMPSPVRAMPTSTTTAPTPSLSSPPLTFTYHPPFKTTCTGKLKFKNEHSTATLGNSPAIPREAGHRGTV